WSRTRTGWARRQAAASSGAPCSRRWPAPRPTSPSCSSRSVFRSRGRKMRAVVVGAGIVGTATALRLAQKGVQVTLVDAAFPGDGTTGTSFAWVGASHRGLWDYFDINVQGMAAYRRLEVELGTLPGFVRTGSLTWGDPELAERVAELR